MAMPLRTAPLSGPACPVNARRLPQVCGAYGTLRRLMAACLRQTGRLNSWRLGRHTHFFQESFVAARAGDGPIDGDIFVCGDDGTTRWLASFRIEADGSLTGPPHMQQLLQAGRELRSLRRPDDHICPQAPDDPFQTQQGGEIE